MYKTSLAYKLNSYTQIPLCTGHEEKLLRGNFVGKKRLLRKKLNTFPSLYSSMLENLFAH